MRTLLRRGSTPSRPDRDQAANLMHDFAHTRVERMGYRIYLTNEEISLVNYWNGKWDRITGFDTYALSC